VNDGGEWGVGGDGGHRIAGVHEVADAGEAAAEASTGVELRELLGLEAAAAADLEGEGVAEGEHDGGRCGGGEVEGAGLGGDGAVEGDEGGLGEGGGGFAAERDDGRAEVLEGGQEGEEFFGFAGGGEGEDEVAGGDHAEVAVEGLGRMEVVGGGAGGAESGGDLARDEAGFADAEEDEFVIARGGFEDLLDGGGEGRGHGAVEADGEGEEGAGLDADEVGGALGWGWSRHGQTGMMLAEQLPARTATQLPSRDTAPNGGTAETLRSLHLAINWWGWGRWRRT
jgi:hypothetical protein